jgi:intracellular sulfur oxidation DsrE/DsrF family protein
MLEYKVIFHIDELNKWKLLLTNVNNLLNASDNDKYFVEVLANAEAVKYYDTTQNLETDINIMEQLSKKGVKFVACNNALTAHNLLQKDLVHFVDIVPAGVVELIVKQSEGYSYIKP